MKSGMKMMAVNEMRRRRDSRGRYMEGGGQMEMGYNRMEGGQMNQGANNRMEGGGSGRMGGNDRMEGEMRGEGNSSRMEQRGGNSSNYNMWPYLEQDRMRRMKEEPDGQNPYGGQPEVYRKQEERKNAGEMRQMAEGKTSAGEVNYKRPDGESGNVRYFMHKTDPMNQRDGMEHMEPMEHQRQIGFQKNEPEDGLDKETVMEWVEEMEDSEGVKGGKYTWHQAQQYAMNKGITGQQRQLEFYWAMNAMYADYHEAGKKFGVDKPDFYACLAKLFIEDPDAVENKVEEYHRHIAKHK